MKRLVVAMVALVIFGGFAAGWVQAHSGGHGLTMGEVVSVTDGGFELKTEAETVTVKITSETKFLKNKKPAEKSLLKKGEWVGVSKSKSESGELSATRIIFGLAKPAEQSAAPKN
jgi:hypothetical protein